MTDELDKFVSLPGEILEDMSIYLSYTSIINLCRTNKRINTIICRNEDFWKRRAYNKFPLYYHIEKAFSWQQYNYILETFPQKLIGLRIPEGYSDSSVYYILPNGEYTLHLFDKRHNGEIQMVGLIEELLQELSEELDENINNNTEEAHNYINIDNLFYKENIKFLSNNISDEDLLDYTFSLYPTKLKNFIIELGYLLQRNPDNEYGVVVIHSTKINNYLSLIDNEKISSINNTEQLPISLIEQYNILQKYSDLYI